MEQVGCFLNNLAYYMKKQLQQKKKTKKMKIKTNTQKSKKPQ